MLCMPRAARTSPQPSSSATPLSEQHSSAGLDAAAQRRKKGRKCLFRRFPVKPGRPGGKRLLGRRTSISGPATTERGSLRAHLAELVAGPSIAALYPPRVGLPCAILPRPRERQAAGWLLHCPLHATGFPGPRGARRIATLALAQASKLAPAHALCGTILATILHLRSHRRATMSAGVSSRRRAASSLAKRGR